MRSQMELRGFIQKVFAKELTAEELARVNVVVDRNSEEKRIDAEIKAKAQAVERKALGVGRKVKTTKIEKLKDVVGLEKEFEIEIVALGIKPVRDIDPVSYITFKSEYGEFSVYKSKHQSWRTGVEIAVGLKVKCKVVSYEIGMAVGYSLIIV